MVKLEKHWTESSTDDFMYRVGADFVSQIEALMGDKTQAQLAKQLGVTEGRVSQVLNNPGNLTLRKVVEYARALGQKVAIVAYNDGDAENQNGPINPQVFVRSWERAGRPSDFFEIAENKTAATTDDTGGPSLPRDTARPLKRGRRFRTRRTG